MGLAAAIAALSLGGCSAGGVSSDDVTTALDYLSLAGQIALAITGGEDEAPEAVQLAAMGAEKGIETYCALPEWDKATVRRDLDPGIRAYVVARYGGADGDICTDDLTEDAASDEDAPVSLTPD